METLQAKIWTSDEVHGSYSSHIYRVVIAHGPFPIPNLTLLPPPQLCLLVAASGVIWWAEDLSGSVLDL